jgi:DNA-binding response OmpR family regulator
MPEVLQSLGRALFAEVGKKPRRIVVAEDDDEMRALVVSALRRDGWEVIEAQDGAHLRLALDPLFRDENAPIDLVVSDIRMPGFSGLEVLQALRRSRRTIPVIMMTGFGDDRVRERVEHLGAFLFDKPFEVDDLRTAIFYLLREHDTEK